ncbi:MAG: aldehyde-activating protein [Myxococcales bacterium]|nr:MAG: aldehyde-activating protein [Myxococcales bacterium]
MTESGEGGCQCGKVRYRIGAEPITLAACHCKECQRQSGSAFGMSLVVRGDDFELLSGELRDFVRSSDSGRTIRCAFCPDCGTRIYHEPTYMEGVLNVKAGTLDDTSTLEPALHAWTGSKQRWISLPEAATCFEGQPG